MTGSSPDENGWRSDMENAPIDGTAIDLWARRKGTDFYERVSDCSWGTMVDWFGDERQDWFGLWRGPFREYEHPTHWRPLPQPPIPSHPVPEHGGE